jgi:hypothetical protein
MNNLATKCLVFLLCVLVAGCGAGKQFARVPDDTLVLGQTTPEQITDLLGSPQEQQKFTRNNEVMTMYKYVSGTPWIPGFEPFTLSVRVQSFTFHNDKLVGHLFTSSFQEDSTNFDETKMSQIVEGKSTRSDVVRLMGNPGGEAIYPVVRRKNETAVNYSYVISTRGTFSREFKAHRKHLTVIFNDQGVVTDVDFFEVGEK